MRSLNRIDSYVNYEDMTDDAKSAIEAGLKLKKEKKKSKRSLLPLDMGDDFAPIPSKKKKVTTPNSNPNPNPIEFSKKLTVLTGNATIQNDGVVGGGDTVVV